MTAIKTVFTRHPVVAYFVLTFLTSWGGIFVVLGPGAFTGATPPTEGSFLWYIWRCSPTGFVIPRMRLRYGILTTGLIVGFLWGRMALPALLGRRFLRRAPPRALFLPVQLFTFLPAYRALMVWV